MIKLYKMPFLFKAYYRNAICSTRQKKTIHLTFDDGPCPEVTPWVLEKLAYYNARATFFCIGDNIEKHIHIAKEALQKNHTIENHTFNHLKGTYTDNDTYFQNIERCTNTIRQLGARTTLFRPPYGQIKKSQFQYLKQKYKIVLWSHLAWDFREGMNSKKSIDILSNASEGSVLVFHDSKKCFKQLQIVFPQIIERLSKKGFHFEPILNYD